MDAAPIGNNDAPCTGHTPAGFSPQPVSVQRIVRGLVVCGIACRILQYLSDRSFWVDEASLVLNIRNKSAAELLGALDFHQAAPPFFLLVERGMFRLIGGSEMALRLFPLLAGCASVILFTVVATRLLPPPAACLALAVFCFSDRLIWHADEVKQYGVEVFFAVALLSVTVYEFQGRNQRQWAALGVLAMVAVWFSYSSVFVFAACGMSLVLRFPPRTRGQIAMCLGWNCAVMLSFLAMFRIVMRTQDSHYMHQYWAEHFVPLSHAGLIPGWLGRRLLSLCNYPTEPGSFIVVPCCAMGLVTLSSDGRRSFVLPLLLLPLTFHLAAAAVQRYPFDGARLTVYLTVPLALLAGAGAWGFYLRTSHKVGPFATAPALLLIGLPLCNAMYHLVIPRQRGNVRAAAAFVRNHYQVGDGVYVLQLSEFAAYWPNNSGEVREAIVPADEIPFRRFWIVWSYPDAAGLRRFDRVRQWAGTFATEEPAAFVGRNNCAYLYRVRPASLPHTLPPEFRTRHPTIPATLQ